MSNPNSNQDFNPEKQGNNQTVVIVQESQGMYALLTFFFSGIGQLCQGRLLAGGLVFLSDIIGYIQCCFLIGIPFQIANRILCICDAALYKKEKPKMTLVIIGFAINLIPLVVLIILGLGSMATNSGQ
ncbi:MAG: hypothetical protein LBJ67_02965 [Planctomycetaceae bacterium]|jgi:TM2 domain-containing membrane protein YozV|nr:hypothetical protein [Planctomycetaceae bacterium]